MIETFERTMTFEPAYDKRSDDPKKNYGIHGVTMRCVLKGSRGAVQFVLYTNWHLPHVTKEKCQGHYAAIGGDPHWMERPMPVDIGYHSPTPMYDGQTPMPCDVLNGECYYDGSSLNAERPFRALLEGGSDGLWAYLENYYAETFATPERLAEWADRPDTEK